MSNLPDPSPTSEEDFDPNAPFIASDGLEYACVADKILNLPIHSHRNEFIREARARGTTEEKVRRWIKAFDGNDPRPSTEYARGCLLSSAAFTAAVGANIAADFRF